MEPTMSTKISARDALSAWHAVNDAGEGFAPAEESVDGAVDAMIVEGGTLVLHDAEIDVVEDSSGRIIAVCDSHGAWACDITEAVQS